MTPRWDAWLGKRGEGYVAIQSLLFLALALAPWAAPTPSIPSGWRLYCGSLLMLTGGPMSLLALINLGRSLSVLPHPKDDAPFVSKGLYALIRHPIYISLLLFTLGWLFFWPSATEITAWASLCLLFDLKARREERLLSLRFPEYSNYCKRVKRFVPWIY